MAPVTASSEALALRIAWQKSEAGASLALPGPGTVLPLGRLPGSSQAFLLAALRERDPRGILICLSDEVEVADWIEDLATFAPERAGRPAPRVLPELERDDEGHPMRGSLFGRRSVLEGLGPRQMLLADMAALMAPVARPRSGEPRLLRLVTGERRDPAEVLALLCDAGLERRSQVLVPGEVSLRGDVLDLHAPGEDEPLRIEWFDDRIESIRRFDSDSQRSTEVCDEIEVLLPEAGVEDDDEQDDECWPLDLLDPAETLIVVVEPIRFEEHFSRFTLRRGSEAAPVASFRLALGRFPALTLSALPAPGGRDLDFEAPRLAPVDSGDLKGRLLAAGRLEDEVLVLLRSQPEADRVTRLAREVGVGRRLRCQVGSLRRGFRVPSLGTSVLNHGEFFGTGVAQRRLAHRGRRPKIPSKAIESFFELDEGDLVVHAVHGIARFRGLERSARGGGQEDCLRLEFADEVEVLVPASQIDLVQKYVGSGDHAPRLDKLGGKAFARRKSQVAQAVRDMAADLLRVQVERARAEGFQVPAEDELYREFLASFPFEDTPDQVKSTTELDRDLTGGRPMDRLLCGDVGFGKTELAMRAAFRVASAGRQVAVLVPTTLLAEQHGRTFTDRMASFPLRVEVYSRLQSTKDKKRVREGLASGAVDIVIGTHALLGKGVRFADLGLLVVDEEQRFGVAHKERIKDLRAQVHVLTLTATPIPRTLHMALLGLKDISSLATPPPGRLEIATKVCARSSQVLRDAILAELRRGGQTFFLHNRVQTLDLIEAELTALVPEVRIARGHGQMPEKELLANMRRFLSGEADLLLSTTIVQSGLDIPRANTILVDGADRFGLSELHQLRGRVGRDITHAYCYLLTDPARPMTREARSRLQAMERFSGLGAGFSLAMKDLEIRGAGNLLGPEQSGHIAAIGYDLYCKLLHAAVERRDDKEQRAEDLPELVVSRQVDVDLGVDAYLPTDFVEDARSRLQLLREMDEAVDERALERIRSSWQDRFGRLPQPVENLLLLFLVKHRIASEGLSSVRFLPPDQCVLGHPAGRGPSGQWLGAFLDVRPVRPDRTHVVLPPHVREPGRVLTFLRDALLGRGAAPKIHGTTRWEPARRPRSDRPRR